MQRHCAVSAREKEGTLRTTLWKTGSSSKLRQRGTQSVAAHNGRQLETPEDDCLSACQWPEQQIQIQPEAAQRRTAPVTPQHTVCM